MSAKPWTEAHQREAIALLCDIAKNAALRGDAATARLALVWAAGTLEPTEAHLRRALADLLDAKVIDREIRRVRRLAEGRLVRETFPAVKVEGVAYQRPDVAAAKSSADDWNAKPHCTRGACIQHGHPQSDRAHVVRVIRIRRSR